MKRSDIYQGRVVLFHSDVPFFKMPTTKIKNADDDYIIDLDGHSISTSPP